MRKPGSENSPYDPPYDFKNSEIDICTRQSRFAQGNSRFECPLRWAARNPGVRSTAQAACSNAVSTSSVEGHAVELMYDCVLCVWAPDGRCVALPVRMFAVAQ